MSDEKPPTRTLTLELDQLDYDVIQQAIAYRQTYRVLPDGDGNMVGRYVAEVCRGFLEMKGVI